MNYQDPGDSKNVHREPVPDSTDPNQVGMFGAPFNGADYVDERDRARLTGQIERVYECMKGEVWRTLNEIHELTGDPHASISAQLRHLRKERFGAYTVDRRHRGDPSIGLYEYRVEVT